MNDAETDRMIAAARAARQAGRRDEAARLFAQVIDRAGEHPLALNALGLHRLGEGDPAAAAALFNRAIAADAHAPDLWMNLARAHREQADDPAERQALEGALAIDQRHFMALVRLAELHERNGATADAAERWSNVLAMAPLLDERSPAIEIMLDHARDVVTRQHEGFARIVDDALAGPLADAAPADRRRVQACIDHALGRRQIFANQCAGLHVPFLPADEFFERRHFPWLEAFEAHTATIRAEVQALLTEEAAGFLPYVAMQPGTPTNKWTPLDNSLDWGALHLWKDGRRNDAACARAPRTAAIVEGLPLSDLPGRTPTVFFSLLRPGAHLPAHTGVSNVRAIVHLPLVVPPGCTFRVGGETRAWAEGHAWAFDDTIEHEAWNRADSVRAILILDVWNPHIGEAERALLRRFATISDASGHGPQAAIAD